MAMFHLGYDGGRELESGCMWGGGGNGGRAGVSRMRYLSNQFYVFLSSNYALYYSKFVLFYNIGLERNQR